MKGRKSISSPWLSLAKLAVVAFCFWLVLRRVSPAEIAESFRNLRWNYVLLAACTLFTEPVIGSIKWRLLMAAGQREDCPSLPLILRVVFTANFLSLLAPTAVSADALRIWLLRRRGYQIAHTGSAMLADRLLGLAVLFLLTLLGWFGARTYLPDAAARIIPPACLLGLAIIAAAFLPIWHRIFQALDRALFTRFPMLQSSALGNLLRKLSDTADTLLDTFQSYRKQPQALLCAGFWNLLIQGLRVTQIYFLFRALGHPVGYIYTLTFVPVIVLLALLPISFYGAGVKEGAFLYLFAQIGVPREISVSVSLLTYPLILSALLPGALFFLLGDNTLPATGETADTTGEPSP